MIVLKKLFLVAAFGSVILGSLAACSSTDQKDPNAVNTEPVSTIPWNRPQNWEGKGVLGGMSGGN
ncbi:MAG: hypothetical protein LBH01_07820 [Verrucomicrobiales bacterium]|jgi:hypothetical protein|nr:hypothetical protein [Verrucomicrobiales bacterium]